MKGYLRRMFTNLYKYLEGMQLQRQKAHMKLLPCTAVLIWLQTGSKLLKEGLSGLCKAVERFAELRKGSALRSKHLIWFSSTKLLCSRRLPSQIFRWS